MLARSRGQTRVSARMTCKRRAPLVLPAKSRSRVLSNESAPHLHAIGTSHRDG